MTSQVILGNGHGVGLASDSVVTVGDRRTYEAAEKVIPLPEPHKVAILISGSVSQFRMPIAVLLKEWIKTLERVPLRKVVDYRASFLSWLQDNLDEFSDRNGRERAGFWSVDEFIGDVWRSLSDANFSSPEERLAAVLEDIRAATEVAKGWQQLPEITEGQARAHVDRLWETERDLHPGLAARLAFWYDDVPNVDVLVEPMKEYLATRLQKWTLVGGLTSLCFVGFGSKEFLPVAAEMKLMNGIGSWIARWMSTPEEPYRNGPTTCLIKTCGQDDAINLMLLGYNPDLVQTAVDKVDSMIAEMTQPQELSTSERSALPQAPDVSGAIWSSVRDLTEERNLDPLRRTIGVLPLRSLAEAARSLVGVQALSNVITAQLATVGGEIDVATITLAEGFRWVTTR